MADATFDIRQAHSPWADPNISGIGRLQARSANQRWSGTAQLIQAEYVLTAAHCLDGSTAGVVTFGSDPGQSIDQNMKRAYLFAAVCIPSAYGANGASWDVGVARLARPVTDVEIQPLKNRQPNALGWHGVGGWPIRLLGYPRTEQGVTPSESPAIEVGPMFWQDGRPHSLDASNNLLAYQLDTRGGHSGGPVMLIETNEMIGVHSRWDVLDSRQVGVATLLTQPVLSWIASAIQALQAQGPFLRRV